MYVRNQDKWITYFWVGGGDYVILVFMSLFGFLDLLYWDLGVIII